MNNSLTYLKEKKRIESQIVEINNDIAGKICSSNFTGMSYESKSDKEKKITDAFALGGRYGIKKDKELQDAKNEDINFIKENSPEKIQEKFNISLDEAKSLQLNLKASYIGTFDEILVSATKSGIDSGKTLGESIYDASISTLKGLGASIFKTIFSAQDTKAINDTLTNIGNSAETYMKLSKGSDAILKNGKVIKSPEKGYIPTADGLIESLNPQDILDIQKFVNDAKSSKAQRFEQQKLMREFYQNLNVGSSESITMSDDILSQNKVTALKEGKGTFGTSLKKADVINEIAKLQDDYDNAIADMALTGIQYVENLRIKTNYESLKMKVALVENLTSGIQTAFNADSYEGTFDAFGSIMQNMLKDKVLNNLIDGRFGDQITTLIQQATNALDTGDLSTLKAVQSSVLSISSQAQLAKAQISGVLSMFDSSKIIDYTDKSRDINFTSASTKDITYSIVNNVSLNAGALIGMNSSAMGQLARELQPYIVKAFKENSITV